MNINDSMLFRWVGYGIENEDGAKRPAPRRKPLVIQPKLSPKQVDDYLEYLHAALNPKRGLRVAPYSEDDKVGKEKHIAEPRACLFLTEQAAATSADHWRLYGRLGFGFAKRFIFDLGGRPLIYTGGSNDPVISSVSFLRRQVDKINGKNGKRAAEHLELLARFIKWTTLPRLKIDGSKPEADKPKKTMKLRLTAVDVVPNANFPDYNPIRFLAEREWRLPVYRQHMNYWHDDTKSKDPAWWFRPEVGRELQVVVVPNNHMIRMAHNCRDIRKLIVGRSGIAVQLISAQTLRRL